MNQARARFTGKVVAITGAGSGIGRSTALLFADLGAKVHCGDIDLARAQRVAREISVAGGVSAAHRVDVSDASAVDGFAERVFEEDGTVDVLHNNAGILHRGETEHTTAEDWRRVIGVNLLGVAYGVQAFVPRMLRQGRGAHIVNTASGLGLVSAPLMAPYCASKFGVVGMTMALNAELSGRGIRVSALCPGIVGSGIGERAMVRGDAAERQQKMVDARRRRAVSPEVVAEAVVDAVVRRKLIQPVPSRYITPWWLLQRISPRAIQLVSRRLLDVASFTDGPARSPAPR